MVFIFPKFEMFKFKTCQFLTNRENWTRPVFSKTSQLAANFVILVIKWLNACVS
jgi:hypothetical protein